MADLQKISQVFTEVAYEVSGSQIVSQVFVEVAYITDGNIISSDLLGATESVYITLPSTPLSINVSDCMNAKAGLVI